MKRRKAIGKAIASKEKKQAMLKKQVLMKKLQAVRAGAGSDITSSYEPEGGIVVEMGEKEHERETMKRIGDSFKSLSSSSAEAGDIARRKAKNKAALKRSEQGAARRKENRNYLRSVGKYKGPMEGVELDEKCWKGYEKKGMKTMFGKRYPNCVKKEE